MKADVIRGSASPVRQLAAFAAAIVAYFVAVVLNAVSLSYFGLGLVPLSAVLVVVACLITIYARSPWPAIALVALEIGFSGYAIAISVSRHMTFAENVALRAEVVAGVRASLELALGALAGWAWYRRESRHRLEVSSA